MTFLAVTLTHMLSIFHLMTKLHAHGHLRHLFLHTHHLLLVHTHHLFLHIELSLSLISHLWFFLVRFFLFVHIHFVIQKLVMHLSFGESVYVDRGVVGSGDGSKAS